MNVNGSSMLMFLLRDKPTQQFLRKDRIPIQDNNMLASIHLFINEHCEPAGSQSQCLVTLIFVHLCKPDHYSFYIP